MKFVSIIAIAAVALIALCSSAPVDNQQLEVDARVDVYNDFLAGLFSGLVQTTFGSVQGFLTDLIAKNPLNVGKRDAEDDLAARTNIFSFLYDNILQDFFTGLVNNAVTSAGGALTNLIQTNPLGIGKRDAEDDLAARADIFSFLYDNILQDFFTGLVNNAFSSAGNALTNLIQTNPLGVGKRDAEDDLAARADIFSFLYDNILQDFFTGLVNNAFSSAGNALTNLIQTNPLGVGKRDAEDDLAARNIFSFLYDNILQDFFTGLVNNAVTSAGGALTNLIQTNPLGIGKRAAGSNVNVLQFLHDNVIADLFGSLASNTAGYLQNALNNLLSKPFANLGKRSVDIQQAQTLVTETVSTLVQKFKTFARQAVASLNDRQKLNELVKENIADIKSTVAHLAKQLSHIIPAAINNEVAQVLAMLQSILVFWTSGLGGSLGPVIGPFTLPKNI